jgi:hypothetical protein
MARRLFFTILTLSLMACGSGKNDADSDLKDTSQVTSDHGAVAGHNGPPPLDNVIIATRPVVAQSNGTVSGATALLEGKVQVAGPCLFIELDKGVRVQPVFAAGTAQWDASRDELAFKNTRYKIGSRIALGGGGVPNDADYAVQPGVIIPACRQADLFVVAG